MKLKIVQVHQSPDYPIASFKGPMPDGLGTGAKLRCGGYRFEVAQVLGGKDSGTFGLKLKSEFGLQQGMVLRPISAPCENDEMASMCARLSQLLQQLVELDAETALSRLNKGEEGDQLLEIFKSYGVDGDALLMFSLIQDLKDKLPPLRDMRKFAQFSGELNDKLSVVALREGTRAELGS